MANETTIYKKQNDKEINKHRSRYGLQRWSYHVNIKFCCYSEIIAFKIMYTF